VHKIDTPSEICALAFAFSTAHIQRAALHSAQRCTARSIAQCPALHCIANIVQYPALHCIANTAQRSVLAAVSPSQEKPSAAASGRTAQRSTKHCHCSSDSKRLRVFARLRLLSAQRIYSAQRYTARSATQRPALYITQRFTARSVAQCAPYYSPRPPALHSAQHCTAPSTTLYRAQRAKTRPIAAAKQAGCAQRGFVAFSLFD